ncbi:MAG: response regulator, partial [Candidatus Kryptoniota bacterium]
TVGTRMDAGSSIGQENTNLELLRENIRRELEQEYSRKYAAEIRRAEQRLNDALKRGQQWQESERTALMAQLEEEKNQYRVKLEAEYRKKLVEELDRVEANYRLQIEKERHEAEEQARREAELKYSKAIEELQLNFEAERESIIRNQNETIELFQKRIALDFENRLKAELDKINSLSTVEEKEDRQKLEEAIRLRLENEFETRLNQEREKVELEFAQKQTEIEESFRKNFATLKAEADKELERRLSEIRIEEENKYRLKRRELEEELEEKYKRKFDEELASERRRLEKEMEEKIRAVESLFEHEKIQLISSEKKKLEDVRLTIRHEIEKEVEEKIAKESARLQKRFEDKLRLLRIKLPESRAERYMTYRQRLKEAWLNPPITVEVARELMQIRELLGLSFEEHIETETEVRLEVYVKFVEDGIRKGTIKPDDTEMLKELKLKFDITPDESARLEPYILSAFQEAVRKATILVVDDDVDFLATIRPILERASYSVVTTTAPDKAMEIINSNRIDLIISDIMFTGHEVDGFTFYQKVQERPDMRKLPFILMSGLQEGVFVRTGVQLGVDDYLVKPVEPELLLAVVEGKLKKYRMLADSDKI